MSTEQNKTRKPMKCGQFEHGYIAACQNLVMLFDEPTIAEEVLRELGLNERQVQRALRQYLMRREWNRQQVKLRKETTL